MKTTYRSDIKLSERYRCNHTGFEGASVAVVFYENGCERVTLKGMNANGEIVEYGFDAPDVTHVTSGTKPTSPRTGGPHDSAPMSRR